MAAPLQQNHLDFDVNFNVTDNIDTTIKKVEDLRTRLDTATDQTKNTEFSNYVNQNNGQEQIDIMKTSVDSLNNALINLRSMGATASIGLGISFEDMQRRLTTSAIAIQNSLKGIAGGFNKDLGHPIIETIDSMLLKTGRARAEAERLNQINAIRSVGRIGSINIKDIEANEVALRSQTEKIAKRFNASRANRNGASLDTLATFMADENTTFSRYIKNQIGDTDEKQRKEIAKYIMLRNFNSTPFTDYNRMYQSVRRQNVAVPTKIEELLPVNFRQTYKALAAGQTAVYDSSQRDPRVEKNINPIDRDELIKHLKEADRFELLSGIFERAGIAKRVTNGTAIANVISRADIHQLGYELTKAYEQEKRGVFGFERNPLDPEDASRFMSGDNKRAKTIHDAIDFINSRFSWVTPADMSAYRTKQNFQKVSPRYSDTIVSRKMDYPDAFYIPSVHMVDGKPLVTVKDRNTGEATAVKYVDPNTYNASMEDILQAQKAAKYREDVPDIPYVTMNESWLTRRLGMKGNGTMGDEWDQTDGSIKKIATPKIIQVDMKKMAIRDPKSNKMINYEQAQSDPTFINEFFKGTKGIQYGPEGKEEEYMFAFADAQSGEAYAIKRADYENIANQENAMFGTNMFKNYNINGIIQATQKDTAKQVDTVRKMASPSKTLKSQGIQFGQNQKISLIDTDLMNSSNGLAQSDWLDGVMLIDPSMAGYDASGNRNSGFAGQFRFLNVFKGMMQTTDWRSLIEQTYKGLKANGKPIGKRFGEKGNNQLLFEDASGNLHSYVAGQTLGDAFIGRRYKDSNGDWQIADREKSREYASQLIQSLTDTSFFDPSNASTISQQQALKRQLSYILNSKVDMSQSGLSEENVDEIRRRFFVDVMDKNVTGLMSNTTIKNATGFRYMTLPMYQKLIGKRDLNQLKADHSLLTMQEYKAATGDIEDNPLAKYSDGKDHEVVKLDREEADMLPAIYANGDINEAFGIMNQAKNFETEKDFVSRQMFMSIGSPRELLKLSNENYTKRLEQLGDKQFIKEHFIDGDERLSRMYKSMGNALLDTSEVRRLVENERMELYRKQFLEKKLFLPDSKYTGLATIGARNIAAATMADLNFNDDIKELIKNNHINVGLANLMSQGLAGTDNETAVYAPALKSFLSKHRLSADQLLSWSGRNPASPYTVILSKLGVDQEGVEEARKLGYSDNAIILSAAQQYKHNTGDFDGDTVDMLMVQYSESVKRNYQDMMTNLEAAEKNVDAQNNQTNNKIKTKGAARKFDTNPFEPSQGRTIKEMYNSGRLDDIYMSVFASGANALIDMGLASSQIDNAAAATDPDRYNRLIRAIRHYDDATTEAKTGVSVDFSDMGEMVQFRHAQKADMELSKAIASGLTPTRAILRAKPLTVNSDTSGVTLAAVQRRNIRNGTVPIDESAMYYRNFLKMMTEDIDGEDDAVYQMALQYAKILDGTNSFGRAISEKDIQLFSRRIDAAKKYQADLATKGALTHDKVFDEQAEQVQEYINDAELNLAFLQGQTSFTADNLLFEAQASLAREGISIADKARLQAIERSSLITMEEQANLKKAGSTKYKKNKADSAQKHYEDANRKLGIIARAEEMEEMAADPDRISEMYDALFDIEDTIDSEERKKFNEDIKKFVDNHYGPGQSLSATNTKAFLRRINALKGQSYDTALFRAASNGVTSIEKFMDLNEINKVVMQGTTGDVTMLTGATPGNAHTMQASEKVIGITSDYYDKAIVDTLVAAFEGNEGHSHVGDTEWSVLGSAVHKAFQDYADNPQNGKTLRELVESNILNIEHDRQKQGLKPLVHVNADSQGHINQITSLEKGSRNNALTDRFVTNLFDDANNPDKWANIQKLFDENENGGWTKWMVEGSFGPDTNGKDINLVMDPFSGVSNYRKIAVLPDYIQKHVDKQTGEESFRIIDWKPDAEKAETSLVQSSIYMALFQEKAKELAKQMDTVGSLTPEDQRYSNLLDLMNVQQNGKYLDAQGNANFKKVYVAGYGYVDDSAFQQELTPQMISAFYDAYKNGVKNSNEFFEKYKKDIPNMDGVHENYLRQAVDRVFGDTADIREAEAHAKEIMDKYKDQKNYTFGDQLLADRFMKDQERLDELEKDLYKEDRKYRPRELRGYNRFDSYRNELDKMFSEEEEEAIAKKALGADDVTVKKMIADVRARKKRAMKNVDSLELEAAKQDPAIAAADISKTLYGSNADNFINLTRSMYMKYENAREISSSIIDKTGMINEAGRRAIGNETDPDKIRKILVSDSSYWTKGADENYNTVKEADDQLELLKGTIERGMGFIEKKQTRTDDKELQKIKSMFGKLETPTDKVNSYFDNVWMEVESTIVSQENAIKELDKMKTNDKFKNNADIQNIIQRIIKHKENIVNEIRNSLTPPAMADKVYKDFSDELKNAQNENLEIKGSKLVEWVSKRSEKKQERAASQSNVLKEMLENAVAKGYYDNTTGQWSNTPEAQRAKTDYETRDANLANMMKDIENVDTDTFNKMIRSDEEHVRQTSEPVRFNLRENTVETIRRRYNSQMNGINKMIKNYEDQIALANQAITEENLKGGNVDQMKINRNKEIITHSKNMIDNLRQDLDTVQGYYEQDGFLEEHRRIERAAHNTALKGYLFDNRRYSSSPIPRFVTNLLQKEYDLREDRDTLRDKITIQRNQRAAYEANLIALQAQQANGTISQEGLATLRTLPQAIQECDNEIQSFNNSLAQTNRELNAIANGESITLLSREIQKGYRELSIGSSGLQKNNFVEEVINARDFFETTNPESFRNNSPFFVNGAWTRRAAKDKYDRLVQQVANMDSDSIYDNIERKYMQRDANAYLQASSTRYGGEYASVSEYYRRQRQSNSKQIDQYRSEIESNQNEMQKITNNRRAYQALRNRNDQLNRLIADYNDLNARNAELETIDMGDIQRRQDNIHNMSLINIDRDNLSHRQQMYQMQSRYLGHNMLGRISSDIQNNRFQQESRDIEIRRLTEQRSNLEAANVSDQNKINQVGTRQEANDLRNKIAARNDEIGRIGNQINNLQEEANQFGQLADPVVATFNAISMSISNMFSRAITMHFRKMIQTAKQFVAQFNTAMAEIQKVTLKTDSEMEKLGDSLIQKAVDMKTSIAEVTKAAQELYKQGLNDNQVNSRLDDLLKFSKVSGQSVEGASKLGIVALNSGMVGNTMEAYDIITAMANRTATDVNSLAVATQKSIYQGKAAGLTYDQLVAMLDAMLSKTQLSGAVTGTAVSNVLSRIMKIGSTGYVYDESGYKTSGEQLAKLLSSVGIDTYKQGKMVSPFTILSQIGQKYSRMDDVTKNAIATQLGGRGGQQASNVRSLLDAFSELDANGHSLIEVLTELASTADGIVDKQYDVEMEKIAAKQAALTASFSKLVDALPVEEGQKAFLDMSNVFVEGLASFASAGDGIVGILGTIAAVAAPLITGGLTGAGSALTTAIPLLGTLGTTLGAIAPPLLALAGAVAAFATIGNLIKDFDEEKKFNSEEERNKRLVNSYKAEATAYANRASSGNNAYETASSYNAQILKGETLDQQQLRSYRDSLISLKQMGYIASDVPTSLDKLSESAEQTAKALGEIPEAIKEDNKRSSNKNFNAFVAGIKTKAEEYNNPGSIESLAKTTALPKPPRFIDPSQKNLNQAADLLEFMEMQNLAGNEEIPNILASYDVTPNDIRNKKGHWFEIYSYIAPKLNSIFYNEDGSFKIPEGYSATDTESFIEDLDTSELKSTFASLGYTEEAIDAEIEKLKSDLLGAKINGVDLTSFSLEEARPEIQRIINERYGYTDGTGQWKLKDNPFKGEKTTYTSLGALMSASLAQAVSTESSLGLYNEIVSHLPDQNVTVDDINDMIEQTTHIDADGNIDSSFIRLLDSNENLKTQFNDLFKVDTKTGKVQAKTGVMISEIDSFVRNLRSVASSVGNFYQYRSSADIGKRAQLTLDLLSEGIKPENLYSNAEDNKAALEELNKLVGEDVAAKGLKDHPYVRAVLDAAAQGRQASFSKNYFADEAVREIESAERGEWEAYQEENPNQLIEKTQSTFDGLSEYVSLAGLSDEELSEAGFDREYVNKLKERLGKSIRAIQMLGINATDKSIQYFEGLSSEIASERIQTQTTMTSQIETGNRLKALSDKLENETHKLAWYEVEEIANALNIDTDTLFDAIKVGNVSFYADSLAEIANENINNVLSTYEAKMREALLEVGITMDFQAGARTEHIAAYIKDKTNNDALAAGIMSAGIYYDDEGNIASDKESKRSSADLYQSYRKKNNLEEYESIADQIEFLMNNEGLTFEGATKKLFEQEAGKSEEDSMLQRLARSDMDIQAGFEDTTINKGQQVAAMQKAVGTGNKGYLAKDSKQQTLDTVLSQYEYLVGNRDKINDKEIESLTSYFTSPTQLRNVTLGSEEDQLLTEMLSANVFGREASYNPALLRNLFAYVAAGDKEGLLAYRDTFKTDEAKGVLDTLMNGNLKNIEGTEDPDKIKNYMSDAYSALLNALFVSTGLTDAKTWSTAIQNRNDNPSNYYETVQSARQQASNYALVQRAMNTRGTYASDQILKTVFGLDDSQLKDDKFVQERWEAFRDSLRKNVDGLLNANGLELEDISNMDQLPESVRDFLEFVGIEIEDGAVNIDTSILTDSIQNIIDNTAKELTNNSNLVNFMKILEIYENSDQTTFVPNMQTAMESGELPKEFLERNSEFNNLMTLATQGIAVDAQKIYSQARGNYDLSNPRWHDPQDAINAGWGVGDPDLAKSGIQSLYSTSYGGRFNEGDKVIGLTPFALDGSTLTQKELDEYMDKLESFGSYEDAFAFDGNNGKRLIVDTVDVQDGNWDAANAEMYSRLNSYHLLHEQEWFGSNEMLDQLFAALGNYIQKSALGTFGQSMEDFNPWLRFLTGSDASSISDLSFESLQANASMLAEENPILFEMSMDMVSKIEGATEALTNLRKVMAGEKIDARAAKDSTDKLKNSVANFAAESENTGRKAFERMNADLKTLREGGEDAVRVIGKMTDRVQQFNDKKNALNEYIKGSKKSTVLSDLSSLIGVSENTLKQAKGEEKQNYINMGKVAIGYEDITLSQDFGIMAEQAINYAREELLKIDPNFELDPFIGVGGTFNIEEFLKMVDKLGPAVAEPIRALFASWTNLGGTIAIDLDENGQAIVKASTGSMGSYRSSRNGGSGSKGKSDAEKLVDRLKKGQELYDHRIKMYQYEETRYQNLDQLANYGRVLQKEIDIEKAYLPVLNENIDALKRQLDATKTGTDDWYTVREALLAAEEKYAEITNTIDENTKKLRENQKAILQTHTSLEDMVKQEIENRIQRQRDMLAGNVSMQDTILDAVKARYEKEWDRLLGPYRLNCWNTLKTY